MQTQEEKEFDSLCEEALHIVRGARRYTYGHPLDNFQRIADIWKVIFGHEVTRDQVALCMVGVKLAREVNAPKRDNWLDMVGYAQAHDDANTEEERRRRENDSATRSIVGIDLDG